MPFSRGLSSTNDFQDVKKTFLSRDISVIKIFLEMRSGVIVWLGVPLLVLGGGLRSTDESKNAR